MKKHFIYTTFLFFVVACSGEDERSSKEYDFTSMDELAETHLTQVDASAVSIAVSKRGKTVFTGAYGTKSQDGTEAVDIETLFQIGSTTKVLTAIATMRQVDQGIFSVDDHLTQLIPDISLEDGQLENWNAITLHHLMTHQGGFYDFTDFDESVEDATDFAKNDFPAFLGLMNPPGKFYNYSNPNWSYLGLVLSEQLNQSLPIIFDEDIFQPLNMPRSTLYREKVESAANYALGIGVIMSETGAIEGAATELEDIPYPTFALAAGGYTWSTPEEMLNVGEFLLYGNTTVLSDANRDELYYKQVDMQGPVENYYGYGLILSEGLSLDDEWYPMNVWHHGGDTLAYSSSFIVLPDEDIVISILSNASGQSVDTIVLEILKILGALPEAEDIPELPVETEKFEMHVGSYASENDLGQTGPVEISLENDMLIVTLPFLDENNISYSPFLTPVGASSFIVQVDSAVYIVDFIANDSGDKSEYIRNRSFVLTRNE